MPQWFRWFSIFPEICAKLLKALQIQGFSFVCQKTLTLKTAGSLKRAVDSGKTIAKRAVTKEYAISQSEFLARTRNINHAPESFQNSDQFEQSEAACNSLEETGENPDAAIDAINQATA